MLSKRRNVRINQNLKKRITYNRKERTMRGQAWKSRAIFYSFYFKSTKMFYIIKT